MTLNVVGGDGITANADNIAVDNTVVRTTGGTIDSLTITGDLTVSGTTTISDVESISSTDPHFVLNADFAGTTPSEDQGMIARRGDQANAALFWDESTDAWSVGQTVALDLSAPTGVTKLWHAGNDGAGSGLDADTLDGVQGSSYARTSTTISAGTGLTGGGSLATNRTITLDTSYTNGLYLGIGAKASDSNLLDGIDSSAFLRSNASDVKTSGNLRFNDNISLTFGSSDDAAFFCNGTHMYTDLGTGIGNWIIRDGTTTRFTFDDAGHFTATGNITANGDIFAKGTKFEGDSKEIIRFSDSWLRLNPANEFANGIYCGSSLFRTDGDIHIGANGETFLADATGVTAPSFNTTSSARYKYDIKETPVEMASSLMKLRPVNYKRKATGKSENGFIAEDMVGVYPELVNLNSNGQVESIDYTKLVVPLVATTQQHNKTLEKAVETINRLDGINKTNRKRISEQQRSILKLEKTLETMQSKDVSTQLARGNKLTEAEELKLELRALREWKQGFQATFDGLQDTVTKSERVIATLLKDKEEREQEIEKLKKDAKANEQMKEFEETKAKKIGFDIKKDED